MGRDSPRIVRSRTRTGGAGAAGICKRWPQRGQAILRPAPSSAVFITLRQVGQAKRITAASSVGRAIPLMSLRKWHYRRRAGHCLANTPRRHRQSGPFPPPTPSDFLLALDRRLLARTGAGHRYGGPPRLTRIRRRRPVCQIFTIDITNSLTATYDNCHWKQPRNWTGQQHFLKTCERIIHDKGAPGAARRGCRWALAE